MLVIALGPAATVGLGVEEDVGHCFGSGTAGSVLLCCGCFSYQLPLLTDIVGQDTLEKNAALLWT